jgi:pyruvate dehydrogenase E1 component alpha subunit
VEAWKKRCPLKRFEALLKEKGLITDEMTRKIIADADREIDESLAYAKSCPDPEIKDMFFGVYAQ